MFFDQHLSRRCGRWFAGVLVANAIAASAAAQAHVRPVADYGKLPLSFEANYGQSDATVKFESRGSGYTVFLTDRAAVLSLARSSSQVNALRQDKSAPRFRADVLRMELRGNTTAANISATEKLPGNANYFIGNDPSKWHTNIPTYAKVKYGSVYPGVDLVYYGNQRQLEYDFVVSAGADPKLIQLHFARAEKLKLDADGELTVVARNGEVAFHKPLVYQLRNGQRQPVNGAFVLLGRNNIGFKIGGYDHARELVIDPTLEYSTYLGAAGSDSVQGIAVDSEGNAYVSGYTYSTRFPTTSGTYESTSSYTATTGVSAVFVSKLNAAGTALVYSTYLTGSQYHCSEGANGNALTPTGDYGSALAVDSSGEAYVTGGTCANDFPTTKGAFQTTYPSQHHSNNVFVTKLNAQGSALLYSTYIGGIGATFSGDWANGIAVDSSGYAYLTGQTSSPNFPTTSGAYQTTNLNTSGKNNAFITKLNTAGSALVYSTYLGGGGGSGGGDNGSSIVVNAAGEAYITGYSYSSNFPTTSGAFQTTNNAFSSNGSNAIVTEINATGTKLVFSTFLGGNRNSNDSKADGGNAIALDAHDDVYIAGGSSSPNFPVTKGAYQAKNLDTVNGKNGVITEVNPTGTALVYSTYIGGSGMTSCGGDVVYALALDALDDIYLTGSTCSSDFPVTSGAYQTTNKANVNKAQTAFFTALNPTGSALLYSTYFGGSGSTANDNGDEGNAIAYSDGKAYFAGYTESTNFPVTTSAYQKSLTATPSGNSNAFIASFAFATASTTTLVTDGTPQKNGITVTFTADVVPSAGSGTPTGTVDFSVDGGAAVARTLDDTGHAAYATSALTPGTHTIVASYLGDATHLPSTSSKLTQAIYGPAASLAIVSGSGQSGPINTAYPSPLIVVVKDAEGDLVPGETITFSGTDLTFSTTMPVTGANGETSVTATPTGAGSLTAVASIGGSVKNVTFPLTATSGTVAEPSVSQTITIADATSGATVYFTTNGSTPTTASTKYTGPITITASETLKFIAVRTGYSNSPVRTVTDTVQ